MAYNILPTVSLLDTERFAPPVDCDDTRRALEASRALDVLYAIDHSSGDESDYEVDGVQEKQAGKGNQEGDEAIQKGDDGKYDRKEGNAPESLEQKPGMISHPSLVWLLQQSTLKVRMQCGVWKR